VVLILHLEQLWCLNHQTFGPMRGLYKSNPIFFFRCQAILKDDIQEIFKIFVIYNTNWNLQHPLGTEHVLWEYPCRIQSSFLQKILESPHQLSQHHLSSGICTLVIDQSLPLSLLPFHMEKMKWVHLWNVTMHGVENQTEVSPDYVPGIINL